MTISQNLVLERRVKGIPTVKTIEGDIYLKTFQQTVQVAGQVSVSVGRLVLRPRGQCWSVGDLGRYKTLHHYTAVQTNSPESCIDTIHCLPVRNILFVESYLLDS